MAKRYITLRIKIKKDVIIEWYEKDKSGKWRIVEVQKMINILREWFINTEEGKMAILMGKTFELTQLEEDDGVFLYVFYRKRLIKNLLGGE